MHRMYTFMVALSLWVGPTAAAGERAAVVVATDSLPVLGSDHVLPQAENEAERLARVLREEAGYDDIRLLLGDSATAPAVRAALDESLAGLDPGGVLFVVWSGFGVGGDFGEPTLLTWDVTKAEPGEGGIDVAALTKHLRDQAKGRSILVAVDAVHEGSVNGLALMGPSAMDWPGLPDEGFAVLSTAGSREVPPVGVLLPAVREAMGGRGDSDGDQRLSVSEWIREVRAVVEAKGAVRPATSGALVASLVVSDMASPTVAPKATGSTTAWAGHNIALVATGGAAAVASLVMYASHRPDCKTVNGSLRCGADGSYGNYRVTQHALGWLGGVCVLSGIGLHVLTDGQPMVGVGGRF